MILQTATGQIIELDTIKKATIKSVTKGRYFKTWVIVCLFLILSIFALFLFLVEKDVYNIELVLNNGERETVTLAKDEFFTLQSIIHNNQRG